MHQVQNHPSPQAPLLTVTCAQGSATPHKTRALSSSHQAMTSARGIQLLPPRPKTPGSGICCSVRNSGCPECSAYPQKTARSLLNHEIDLSNWIHVDLPSKKGRATGQCVVTNVVLKNNEQQRGHAILWRKVGSRPKHTSHCCSSAHLTSLGFHRFCCAQFVLAGGCGWQVLYQNHEPCMSGMRITDRSQDETI